MFLPRIVTGRRGSGKGSFRALNIRNFRRYFAGQMVSTIGTWMQMLAQAWVVLQLTDSAAALGLTVALQSLPILVVGAYGGVIADRLDNRQLLRITNTAGIAQAGCLCVLQLTGHLMVAWIFVFAVALGVIELPPV